jgi:hypothetical protein
MTPWSPPPALEPLYFFLPLALAGIVTFALFSVQSIAQLFVDQDEDSK